MTALPPVLLLKDPTVPALLMGALPAVLSKMKERAKGPEGERSCCC
jgi:hypothetical protein